MDLSATIGTITFARHLAGPCLLLWMAAAAWGQTQPTGLLSGVVADESGKPIGGAKVMVEAVLAATTVGWAEVNSYEAGKQTVTAADGRFAFGGMRGEAFVVSVVAEGYRGVRLPTATAGQPLDVRLKPLEAGVSPMQRIRIRLIDEADAPIVGAWLRVEAVYDLRTRSRPGDPSLVDAEGVSDINGEIELRTQVPRMGIGGWISARGYVAELISGYSSGVAGREGFELSDEQGAYSVLRLSRGFPAAGTLWRSPENPSDGKPMAGQVVEVVRVTSNPRHVDRTRVLTGDDGRFELPRVAAHLTLRYYGVIGQPGATLTTDLTVDPDSLDADRALDVGALLSPPTVNVSGRLVLEGGVAGEGIEPGTRLRLKRARGWDSLVAEVGPDGRFVFQHLPAGMVAEIALDGETQTADRTGLILAGDQPGFDVVSDAVVGLVDQAVDGLVVKVRRGRRLPLGGLTPDLVAELRERRERLESEPLGRPRREPGEDGGAVEPPNPRKTESPAP